MTRTMTAVCRNCSQPIELRHTPGAPTPVWWAGSGGEGCSWGNDNGKHFPKEGTMRRYQHPNTLRGRYSSNAQSDDIKRLFGLEPKQKWDARGHAGIVVGRWFLWVNPLVGISTRYRRSTHRAMARCLECTRTVSAGRIQQHKCPDYSHIVKEIV